MYEMISRFSSLILKASINVTSSLVVTFSVPALVSIGTLESAPSPGIWSRDALAARLVF